MRKCFIFCHGWGGSVRFWDNLKKIFYMNLFNNDLDPITFFLDLGYFGDPIESVPKDLLINQELEFIGIGHSFGLIKLLSLNIKFKALVGLQGFINFLGKDPKLRAIRTKELDLFIKKFSVDPLATLENFYRSVGINIPIENDSFKINQDRLINDLKLLTIEQKLDHDLPVFIMGTQDDPIVPQNLIFDNFAGYRKVQINILPKGIHGLGCKDPEMIYSYIMKFLHEIK